MANYTARQLDARNIGSSIGIDMGGGETLFGTIVTITRKSDVVEIGLVGDEVVDLQPFDIVDIHLPAAGLQGLHTKHAVERMVEQLDDLISLLGRPAPVLKAV